MDERLLGDQSDEQHPSSPRDKHPPKISTTTFLACLAKCFFACLALLLLCVLAWGPSDLVDLFTSQPPEFSVTIHGFSGLDDSVPRRFNLTLSIDNLADTEFEVCMGGEAVVLYGGVPLAVGRVQELCVPRKGAADLDIIAASGGVGVPEALAELMAGEKRADGAVHVEVRVVSETAKHRWFLSCAAALDEEPTRPYPCEKAILVDESDGVRPDDN